MQKNIEKVQPFTDKNTQKLGMEGNYSTHQLLLESKSESSFSHFHRYHPCVNLHSVSSTDTSIAGLLASFLVCFQNGSQKDPGNI